ncbi:DUF952 domain-containing protein [Streptomyces sp. NRRL F-5053]|uniref:DUF952 domain-containing protein n=1 Tax=Streptomyces sp. NRRL F-5053 TaxID=1463854 RepID=UPI0004CB61AF|nr:DUF952 domain-containing protein [Streptomyces sp. NRRL F-5053]
MTEILHLTERAHWDAALASGSYEMSTRGRTLAEVGFIHGSLRRQLPSVAELLYGDHPDPDALVVLVVDSARVPAPIRYEAPEPGAAERYPHIYGPLPVDAVVATEPWRRAR